MNDRHPDPRKYSEDEVGLILRRATEMQRAEPTAPDPTGLTLGELEEIAAEAGIDPRLLRRAASELQAAGPQTFVSRVTGAPVSIEIERWVDGEIPSSSLEELAMRALEQAVDCFSSWRFWGRSSRRCPIMHLILALKWNV